jgi:CheY-like chemotaxis protein
VLDTVTRTRPAVLIAESEPDLRALLSFILRDASYETALASDGIEVVDAVARGVPDLLVLDLHLARLDGLVALEVIRAISKTLPVVVISAVSGPALGLAAERLGLVAVLPMPFRNADLLDAVARGLAQRSGLKGSE